MNNQNIYHDIKDVTTESGLPDEPVTLTEMKDYMRLEGFVDVDESTTEELSDFDFDDDLIEDFITAARKKLEKHLGLSIVYHSWKDCFTNGAGDTEIRNGPIREITEVTYKDDTVIYEDSYETTGFDFLTLDTVFSVPIIVYYEAGYEDCPEELRIAIMKIVWHWFQTRDLGTLPEGVLTSVSEFKRAWTWLA